jgi:hypothetical protein
MAAESDPPKAIGIIELYAYEIERVCVGKERFSFKPSPTHDCVLICKGGHAFKARLNARHFWWLCENGIDTMPVTKASVDYASPPVGKMVETLWIPGESRIEEKIDPKDDETIAKHLDGWPCKSFYKQRLAEVDKERLDLQRKLQALDEERKELVKKL